MKKIAAVLMGALVLSAPSAFAQPVNQMAANETAIGVGTKDSYMEHKITNKATVGFQHADRDAYGNQKDAYLQYDVIGSQVKLVGGYRWGMAGDKDNVFGGVALSTPKVMGFEAYASYIAGKEFNETEVGLNHNLMLNIDLNVNYHNFKPDQGKRENGVGAGITVKF